MLIPYVVGLCFTFAIFRPGLVKLRRARATSPSPSAGSRAEFQSEAPSIVCDEEGEDELVEEAF